MISDILTVLCQLTLMALIGYQWLLLRRAAHWLKESFAREEALVRELDKAVQLLDQGTVHLAYWRQLAQEMQNKK